MPLRAAVKLDPRGEASLGLADARAARGGPDAAREVLDRAAKAVGEEALAEIEEPGGGSCPGTPMVPFRRPANGPHGTEEGREGSDVPSYWRQRDPAGEADHRDL